MITRYTLFEGSIHPGQTEAFRAAVNTALASPQRALAKTATEAVLERYFTGRIHHHITEAVEVVA
jgi:hypothetical protein